ncbi:MAG TPA: DUF3293 domain-containing protein [Candidatus Saccharimonadia bacterium]|nr:DUF3293 domain-containing protein [Candidatus Saccharimonadia bacterium]
MKTPPEDSFALLRAYLGADYSAGDGARKWLLRIGQTPQGEAEADVALAFLTAWNPRSLARGERENTTAMADLRAALERDGARVLDGEGSCPEGTWSEPSFLALGLSPERADAHAARYEQNAIVTARAGEPARLRVYRVEWKEPVEAASIDTRFIDWVASPIVE